MNGGTFFGRSGDDTVFDLLAGRFFGGPGDDRAGAIGFAGPALFHGGRGCDFGRLIGRYGVSHGGQGQDY